MSYSSITSIVVFSFSPKFLRFKNNGLVRLANWTGILLISSYKWIELNFGILTPDFKPIVSYVCNYLYVFAQRLSYALFTLVSVYMNIMKYFWLHYRESKNCVLIVSNHCKSHYGILTT